MATNDVWRASCVGDWGTGRLGVITLAFKEIASGASLPTLAGQIRTTLLYPLCTYQDDTWFWRGINFNTMNKTPPESQSVTTDFPNQGSISGEALPYMDAVVVSLRTAYAGRAYRGRNYLPGFAETQQADSLLVGGTLSAIQTMYDNLIALFGVGGTDPKFQLGIWSRQYSVFTACTQAIVRQTLATQRRRRPGVGG